jgi:hypothetical protein
MCISSCGRETEVKQLQGWKATIEKLVENFSELAALRARASAQQQQRTEGGGDIEAPASTRWGESLACTALRNGFRVVVGTLRPLQGAVVALL